MRVIGLFLVAGLAGCAFPDSTFVYRVAEADCEQALECYDDAILTFNGWDSLEACMDEHGPLVATWGDGCTAYDAKAAKECTKQLEDRGCPAEGDLLDYPEICAQVYAGCPTGDTDDTDTEDLGDSGE